MSMKRQALDDRRVNRRALDEAEDSFLFPMIVIPRRTVDVSVDIDVDWVMPGRISCNEAV